jgi:hypothetical protein
MCIWAAEISDKKGLGFVKKRAARFSRGVYIQGNDKTSACLS